MARALPPPITLTERAAARVQALIARSETPVAGLRIGVKTRGCSGLSYFMEYAAEKKPFEEVVESHGVSLLIDPAATMFLLGTQMDWVEEPFGARFVFNNPNEVDRCGCGESFRTAAQADATAG